MTFYYNNNNYTGDETDSSSSSSSYSGMALDTLRAMRQQEIKNYQVPTAHLERADEFPDDIPLYLEWRRAMIGWNYNIASTCKFENDTVEIAMSIVDRFVAVQTELLSEAHRYQVACMTGLYIAAKIHEQQCLTPKQMETLSCGRFLAQDIEDMEQEILKAIQWRVNPPTAAAFCRTLVDLIPLELVPDRATVLDVAQSHIPLAMTEEFFLLEASASSLALASVMNALRCVLSHDTYEYLDHYFAGDFSDALSMTGSSFTAETLQQKLRALVVQSLSSGKILNEAIVTAYYQQQQQQQQQQNVEHGSSFTNNKQASLYGDARESPRSVAERRRYVKVQIC